MNWQFWKKDDFADFKLPPLSSSPSESSGGAGAEARDPFGSSAGFSTNSFGGSEHSGGADLSGGFESPQGGMMPGGVPGVPSLSATALPPLSPSTSSSQGSSMTAGFQTNQQGFGAVSQPLRSQAFDEHEQQYLPSAQQTSSNPHVGKDIEVISAKLDAIRAQLDSLGVRLASLEQRIPPPDNGQNPRRPWY